MDNDMRLEEISEGFWQVWRKWSETARQSVALSPEQYWILRTLARNGAHTVSALASMRGVTPSAMTIATRRMEDSGWITRTRPATNQRQVMIALSEDGHLLWKKMQTVRRTALQEMLQGLTKEEQDTLRYLLKKMYPSI